MQEAGRGGPNRNVQAEIRGWLDSWPGPFPSREAAVEFFGDGPVGEGWAVGLAEVERNGGLVAALRLRRDVRVAGETAQRSFWNEWSEVTCPTLAILGQSGIIPRRDRRDAPATPRDRGLDYPWDGTRRSPGATGRPVAREPFRVR
jgi:hypothetical protein